jgi:hypothetical protein
LGAARDVSFILQAHPLQGQEHGPGRIRWKGVGKVYMKRLVIITIIKMCAESILLATVFGVAIGIIGYINEWNTPLSYSNAFFIAGCLAIVTGVFSRLEGGKDWDTFQLLSGESFRGMSSGERANFIINASNSLRAVVLGVLTGILLVLISVFVTKIF